jgi:transposase
MVLTELVAKSLDATLEELRVQMKKRVSVEASTTTIWRGTRVEYLLAYSPDFNPIEECISKIKAILVSLKARTRRKLKNTLTKL